jgi:serine/threonine protein kinase
MVNIATIVEEPVKLNKTYHILYEVAAFDLNILLTTANSQLREKRKESAPPSRNNSMNMQPADLVLESRNLADALDYLHSRLYNTKKISLAHNDIKPENILVVYPDSTDPKHKYPVGKWKLADFGLSHVKDKGKAETKRLGPEDALGSPVKTEVTHRLEPSTSVSKTFPKREAGRYTAPEQDQDDPQKSDGRRADVWSFGCVLSEVIAYAVQLDCTLVNEFREHLSKPNYSDQRFYDVQTKDIKPCFHEYLDTLPGKVKGIGASSYGPDWVNQCTDLVKKIVVKDPSKRLGADKIRDTLRDIYRYMRPERRLWVDSHLNVDTAVEADSSSSSGAESPKEMEQSAPGSYGSLDQLVQPPRIEITQAPPDVEHAVRRQSSPI